MTSKTSSRKGVVFITGDVHHASMKGYDNAWLKEHGSLTEVEAAVKFAGIAKKHTIPVTFFITGRAIIEETSKVRLLRQNDLVELGAHTFNAMQPHWLHLVYKVAFRSYYGSAKIQRGDIQRVVSAFKDHLGETPKLWRTHSYRSDQNTVEILQNNGFVLISDEVGADKNPYKKGRGLLSVPINTTPDHENLYHGYFTEEAVKQNRKIMQNAFSYFRLPKTKRNTGRFIKELVKKATGFKKNDKHDFRCYHKREYFELLKSEIEVQTEQYGFANVLLHPGCMEVVDEMAELENFFTWLKKYSVRHISAAVDSLNA